MVIKISHLSLNHNHGVDTRILTGVFGILRIWSYIQIGTAGKRYGKHASCKKYFI